jgi:hypothetical protein
MTRACPKCGTLFTAERQESPATAIPKQRSAAGIIKALASAKWTVTCGNGHEFEVVAVTRLVNAPNEYDLA